MKRERGNDENIEVSNIYLGLQSILVCSTHPLMPTSYPTTSLLHNHFSWPPVVASIASRDTCIIHKAKATVKAKGTPFSYENTVLEQREGTDALYVMHKTVCLSPSSEAAAKRSFPITRRR